MSEEQTSEDALLASLTDLVRLLLGHRTTPLSGIKALLGEVDHLRPFLNPSTSRKARDADVRIRLASTLDQWLPQFNSAGEHDTDGLTRLGLPSNGAERAIWHNLLSGKKLESKPSFLDGLRTEWTWKQPDLIWDVKGVRNRVRDVEAPLIARAIMTANEQARIDPGFGHRPPELDATTNLADSELLASYLRRLAASLDVDPWPTHISAKAQPLVPSHASVARTLSPDSEGRRDPGEVWGDSDLLVILGSGGTGKTWLSRKLARDSAQSAIQALADGRPIDAIEIPLWVTAQDLLAQNGTERHRLTSAALQEISTPDDETLTRLTTLLQRLLPRSVVFIDSLDEASQGPGSLATLRRIQEVAPRVLATSRAEAWRNQIHLDPKNPRHRSASLVPLTYPDDVERLIDLWFDAASAPQLGESLKSHLAVRRDLASAATTPIVAVMQCVAAAEGLILEDQQQLYDVVIDSLLRSGWRESGPVSDSAVGQARRMLRLVAQAGVRTDTETQLGAIDDDISAIVPETMGESAHALVDAIAPRAPALATLRYRRPRRFIHRSFHEHLVAVELATKSVEEAAELLMPHLWFDAQWRGIVARTAAYHPERSALIQRLRTQMAAWFKHPAEPIDHLPEPTGEFAQLLCQAAALTRPDDWSGLDGLFASARHHQMMSGSYEDAGLRCTHWSQSNEAAVEGAIAGLREGLVLPNAQVVDVCSRLDPTDVQRNTLRRQMLDSLAKRGKQGESPVLLRQILYPAAQALGQLLDESVTEDDLGLLDQLLPGSHFERPIATALASTGATTLAERQYQRLMAAMESPSEVAAVERRQGWTTTRILPLALILARTSDDHNRIQRLLWDNHANLPEACTILWRGHLDGKWELSETALVEMSNKQPYLFVDGSAPEDLGNRCYEELWQRADTSTDALKAANITDHLANFESRTNDTRRLLLGLWERFAPQVPMALLGSLPTLLMKLGVDGADCEPSIGSTIWRDIRWTLERDLTGRGLDPEFARNYLTADDQTELVRFCLNRMKTAPTLNVFLAEFLSQLDAQAEDLRVLLELCTAQLGCASSGSMVGMKLQAVIINLHRKNLVHDGDAVEVVRQVASEPGLHEIGVRWLTKFASPWGADHPVTYEAVRVLMQQLKSEVLPPEEIEKKFWRGTNVYSYARAAWDLAAGGPLHQEVHSELLSIFESNVLIARTLLPTLARAGIPLDVLDRADPDLRDLQRVDVLNLLRGTRMNSPFGAWQALLRRASEVLRPALDD